VPGVELAWPEIGLLLLAAYGSVAVLIAVATRLERDLTSAPEPVARRR
jgi:hypothetical protein